MTQKIVITKAGHEALTEANINEYIFHSDYNTFKVLAEGSITGQVVTGNPTTFTVAHGKDYVPAVMAFIKYPDGYVTLPGGSERADFIRHWEVEIDSTNIYFMVYNGDSGAGSYSVNTLASEDDGSEATGGASYSYIQARLVVGRTAQPGAYNCDCCARFANVTIPKGSTINSASILLHENGLNLYDTTPDVKAVTYGIDEDNTNDFSTNPFGRTKTTAHKHSTWSFTNNDFEEHSITDLASVVQEIIDRNGWVSGNAMGFLINNDGSSDAQLGSVYSYDGDSAHCPELIISYTVPSFNVDLKYYIFETPSNS